MNAVDNLRIRGKFNLLLAIQVLALLVVGGMGWSTVAHLQTGQTEISEQLTEAAALSRMLNSMNIIRTIHTSMIGGAADPEYIAAREKRLQEYLDTLRAEMKADEALPWSPEDKVLLGEASAAFQKYQQGFPALLAEARADRNPKTISRLMEANVETMRVARDRLLNVQKATAADAEKAVKDNQSLAALGRNGLRASASRPSSSAFS